MQVKIIKIGNSKGLRLNKAILEKYDFNESVELTLMDDHLEIRPSTNPREGWDKAFKQAKDDNQSELLIPDVFEDEEFPEWK